METPSSIAISQDSLLSQKRMQEETKSSSTAKPDRSALVDITNDSPIVGLAAGSLKTPSSSVAKSRGLPTKTPGSGEALLRGQVKTLLQKVDEETELVKLEHPQAPLPPFRVLLSHLLSPRILLAPTPANTPQISSAEADLEMPQVATVSASLHQAEQLGECQLNRALLFDSPEKSEFSDCSSVCSALTYEGSAEEDGSSAWSTKVNAGSGKAEEQHPEEAHEDMLAEICKGISEMCVNEYAGKHTRFIYNSDDDIEGEEEVGKNGEVGCCSPNVIVLKGLPVPEGKHLRFQEDDE